MPESEQAQTPPSGWAAPDAEETRQIIGELQQLLGLVNSFSDVLPDDLRAQLVDLARKLLALLRVLIDLLMERLEHLDRPKDRDAGTVVQDIPIF